MVILPNSARPVFDIEKELWEKLIMVMDSNTFTNTPTGATGPVENYSLSNTPGLNGATGPSGPLYWMPLKPLEIVTPKIPIFSTIGDEPKTEHQIGRDQDYLMGFKPLPEPKKPQEKEKSAFPAAALRTFDKKMSGYTNEW